MYYIDNRNNSLNKNINNEKQVPIINYIFPKKFLINIDSSLYINSILQCLAYISELNLYFLNEYQIDSLALKRKNNNIKSKGELSSSFYNIITNSYENINDDNNKSIRQKYNNKRITDKLNTYLNEFKNVIINYNPEFKNLESNNLKSFIICLLHMMHEELNYLGVNNFDIPNKNKKNEFNDFNLIFNRNNYSIISKLFYGTFKETKKCNTCNNINFNYQKFGLISFEMKKYSQKKFNIYDGFKDNEKPKLLSDNNKIYCNICKNLSDYQYYYKIIEPPSKLLININYDNNENNPSKVEFDEIIDISKYINLSYKLPIKYRINFICSYSIYILD